jgi:hypothetical protein
MEAARFVKLVASCRVALDDRHLDVPATLRLGRDGVLTAP